MVISPEGQFVVAKGRTFTITCTDMSPGGIGVALVIDRNANPDTTIPREANGAEITFSVGPVNANVNGTVFRCRSLVTAGISPDLIVVVQGEDCVYTLCTPVD